jgi:hypothetical protein
MHYISLNWQRQLPLTKLSIAKIGLRADDRSGITGLLGVEILAERTLSPDRIASLLPLVTLGSALQLDLQAPK